MNRPPNRLASSTSPYLLQHQHNPVDWYPWGEEALSKARSEDRPIFLSIGYSACHWCHVMEKESFEDEATAALMNASFVCIKVDREERPDLDEIYMTAVQIMTGSGGWPMSVWLTPDLEPFYAGTYFPPAPRQGLPSFQQVLGAIEGAWRSDRAGLTGQARRVREAVERYLVSRGAPAASGSSSAVDPLAQAVSDLSGRFDAVNGGFSTAPKFPPSKAIVLLLRRWRDTKDENLRRMAARTLDGMADGGIHDQIGGGFHRYATDARWQIPHFEKMLYDNALLADAYLEGWRATQDERYREVARGLFGWVRREMTDTSGAFWSSLDADSEGEEGRFYVWTPDEVVKALGPTEAPLASQYYGITPSGNFERGTSIPHVDVPLAAFAEARKEDAGSLARRLAAARGALLGVRDRRVRPHLDDKILTAWNGLMIAAMARAAGPLEDPALRDAASKAAAFLLASARGPDGLMRVSFRKGRLAPDAFLDDQAFFIEGLLALHEAGAGRPWLAEAEALARAARNAFADPQGGAWYFTPPGRADLIVRARNANDGAIPSGNAVMASNLLALARVTGDNAWREDALKILEAATPEMQTMPGAFHTMILALKESGPAPSARAQAAPHVTVTPRLLTPRESGSSGIRRVELLVSIPSGWHIQASSPSLPELIPTRVELAGGPVSLVAVDYPEGVLRSLGFAGRPLAVYEGTVPIVVSLSAPAHGGAPMTARGEVAYQACDDRACLPPARAPFTITLP